MCKRIYLYILMSLFFSQMFSMSKSERNQYNAKNLRSSFIKNRGLKELKSTYLLEPKKKELDGLEPKQKELDELEPKQKELVEALSVLDSKGLAPFFYCFLAPKLDLDMVDFLLQNNAPIGKGALFADYKDEVKEILKYTDPKNNTVLHRAVKYKHLELIEFFVKNGEYQDLQEINIKNKTVVNLIAEKDIKFIEECIKIFRNYLDDKREGIEKYLEEVIFDKKSRCCCEQF